MVTDKNIIIQKLDSFIRKYYKNQLIKGLIYFIALGLSLGLIILLLEYFGKFNSLTRGILLFGSLSITKLIAFQYILIPLFKIYRLGKIISYKEAALIVGKHFPEVSDKLINLLQLEELGQNSSTDNSLLRASIEQKTLQLQPIPFQNAINFKENIKFLKYAAIPVVILILVSLFNSSIITNPARRILNFNVPYEKMAPFNWELLNKDLYAVQNQNLTLDLKISGDELPDEVYIEIEGNPFKMRKISNTEFSYELRNLQSDINFNFSASGYKSDEFNVKVDKKAGIMGFEVYLDYPSHTGRNSELLKNMGDLQVPEGTKIRWEFNTLHAEHLYFSLRDTNLVLSETASNKYSFSKRFLKSESYSVQPIRAGKRSGDLMEYQIEVIPDAFPQIDVEERPDSLSAKLIYFLGNASDDYGISKLDFVYRFIKTDDPAKDKEFQKINIKKSAGTDLSYYHFWDLNQLNILPGEELEYYFEVTDNDVLHGGKKSRSGAKVYQAPSQKEIREQNKENAEKLSSQLENAIKKTKEIEKSISDLQKKLANKKSLSWEEKKQIEDLLKSHEELKKEIEEIQKQNEINRQKEQDFKRIDQELLEKQEQLDKLFEELMSEEMKELMKELEELMQQQNKDLLQKELEKFEMNSKEMNKELDRMLELYKEMEVEKQLEDIIERSKDLSNKQEELSKKADDKSISEEELQKEQEKLNEEFKDLEKDVEETLKKNEELENPKAVDKEELNKKEEEIKEDMQESKEELGKKKRKQAQKKQKEAAEKMKEMAERMESNLASQESSQAEEDYNTLREIMENLLELSFQQEALMGEMKGLSPYDPKIVELGQKQRRVKDGMRIIEDSLFALARRVPAVSNFITKEVNNVQQNMGTALSNYGERSIPTIMNHQQLAMTGLNNLAVMLSEVLKNMQDQMNSQNQSDGTGKCRKPGGGKPKEQKLSDMKEQQKQLQKQLDEMKKGMQKDKGKQQPGGKSGQGSAEQWAKMAAMQAKIRQEMKELQRKLEKEGKMGEAGELKKTQEMMEKVEKDLYNKEISPETIKRQEEILTRMLEHEKAEKEREQEERRESNEAKEIEKSNPPNFEQYIRMKEKEAELLRTIPPSLKPYYKDRVRRYLKN